jgi:hypothetical protein
MRSTDPDPMKNNATPPRVAFFAANSTDRPPISRTLDPVTIWVPAFAGTTGAVFICRIET